MTVVAADSMRDLGPATEDDVALAFVQAEIDSARFGPHYAAFLSNSRVERSSIVDQPNLQSARENWIRGEMLTTVRGYGGNRTLLLKGFPQNVTWRKVAIEAEDVGKLKYANYVTWVQLSGGSRLVIGGARRADATQSVDGEQTSWKMQLGPRGRGRTRTPHDNDVTEF
jgi:hypothetical protein